jgi:hypothetical protein
MKRLSLLLFAAIGLFACKQVDDLSDAAEITAFEVLSYTPTNARIGEALIEANIIYIVDSTTVFPLTLLVRVKTSSTTDDVLELPDSLVFPNKDETFDFYLIAESGVPHKYQIKLRLVDSGADILRFQLNAEESKNTAVDIDEWNATVAISRSNAVFPFILHPDVTLSDKAAFKADNLDVLTFTQWTDTIETVITALTGDEKTWKIYLADNSQLPNSEFELWTSDNIDPFPGKGRGWSSANNSVVKGTLPVEHDGGYAAQMKTARQDVDILGIHLIAAG